jgi:uncharacterized membrane protein YgaE (UPF0421/DUF939 family)
MSHYYDDREHQAFDRYLQPRSKSFLPSTIKRRLIMAFRSIYTTALVLVALYQYEWGNVSTYLSPVLASTSATFSIGEFLQSFAQLTYGTILGTLLGTGIAYTYRQPALLLFLLFICLIFINSSSFFTQSGKVNGNLNLILTVLWPSVTNGELMGVKAILSALPVPFMPYIITCFTLLFPVPTLAIQAARVKAESICQELSSINIVLVRGFIAQDFHDMYDADFDNLYRRVSEELQELKSLNEHSKYEILIFPYLEDRTRVLSQFYDLALRLLNEYAGLRAMLSLLKNNYTQSKFVEAMSVSLDDIAAEIAIAMRLICEEVAYFETPESYMLSLPRRFLVRHSSIVEGRRVNSEQEETIRRRKGSSTLGCSWLWDASSILIMRRKNEMFRRKIHGTHVAFDETDVPIFEEYIPRDLSPRQRAEASISNSSPDFQLVLNPLHEADIERMDFDSHHHGDSNDGSVPVVEKPSPQLLRERRQKQFKETMTRLDEAKENMVDAFTTTYNFFIQAPHRDSQMMDSSTHSFSMDLSNETPKADSLHKLVSRRSTGRLFDDTKAFADDNHSIRNLNPRSAYVHRLSEIIRSINGFDAVFTTNHDAYLYQRLPKQLYESCENWWISVFVTCMLYLSSVKDFAVTLSSTAFQWSAISMTSIFASLYSLWEVLKPYKQAIKIAAAIVLTAVLVVAPNQSTKQQQDGLSAVLIIAFIRQDNTSSSFLVGYQRLEGTVIGAVYAFTTYNTFQCQKYPDGCPSGITIPVLLIWLGICSFFRDGPRHGYAAMVAGFTPIVLFIGPTSVTTDGAWSRVERTFIGVAIYLIIDNLILPTRTSSNIRRGVLSGLDETVNMFNELIESVKQLVNLSEDKMTTSIEFAETHLQQAHIHVEELGKILSQQSTYLGLVMHDPVIWQRPFPITPYTNLIDCFQRLLAAARDVEHGAESLAKILNEISTATGYSLSQAMPPNNQQYHFYQFMSKRIFAVVDRTNAALRMTCTALHRVYENDELRTDLSPLLTISRYFDRLLREVDNKFQDLFLDGSVPVAVTAESSTSATSLSVATVTDNSNRHDSYFLLAWQNIFESLCAMLNVIAELGQLLHRVRNIEAVNAT